MHQTVDGLTLRELEAELVDLHNRFTLRPALDHAREIGERLLAAKRLVRRGEWMGWVRRLGMNHRSANVYMQVAKSQSVANFDDRVTINEFLTMIRCAKRAVRAEERMEARKQAMRSAVPADDRYRVVHTDARKYRWPKGIDVICTDPLWDRKDDFRWLAKFAMSHLRDGGLLLCQCGVPDMAEVLAILTGSGLRYIWTLALVYDVPFSMANLPLSVSWRPVLMLSRGSWNSEGLVKVTNAITSRFSHCVKVLYEFQQPARPYYHWIESLTRPGELICDPFTGSATVGACCKAIGARRFLGTELNEEMARVAQGRINKIVEGSGVGGLDGF